MDTLTVTEPRITFVPFAADVPTGEAARHLAEVEAVAEVTRALNALAYSEAA